MSEEITCNEVEGVLFDFRRDELSDLRRAEIQEHLEGCATCRKLHVVVSDAFEAAADADASTWGEFDADALFSRVRSAAVEDVDTAGVDGAQRLGEAFAAAREVDDETWGDFDSDDMFDRIASDIGAENASEDVEPVEPSEEAAQRTWAVIAAAACVVLAAGWALSAADVGPAPHDRDSFTEVATKTSQNIEEEAIVAEEGPGDSTTKDEQSGAVAAAEDIDEVESLPAMKPAEAPLDSVRLLASADAEYSVVDDEGSLLDLKKGAVLVEFLPDSEESFAVQAAGYTITVVGTVFSVRHRADGVGVAVYEGAVRVTSPDGLTREVRTGEFVARDARGDVAATEIAMVDQYVDLEAHRSALHRRGRDDSAVELAVHGERSDTERSASKSSHERAAPDDGEPDVSRSTEQTPPGEETSSDRKNPAEEEPVEEEPVEAGTAEADGVAAEAEPSSPRELRGAALEARHQGEYRRATQLLERALRTTIPRDPANADILLELARIHLRQLDEPGRAAHYLRRFANEWPNDPAADAIRSQLCEMEGAGFSDDDLCD